MTCHSTKPLGDRTTHYWLVKSMAEATGADLAAEMAAGRLTQDDWSGMVETCRGCGWERDGGGCGKWLALQVPGEAHVPDACVNQAAFAALSDEAG